MFRRLSKSLPKDPEFPADLEKLGYYINDRDQIRSIARPDQDFHFFISKNERVLETHREAMNDCVRTHLATRFSEIGLKTVHLPSGPSEPNIPILHTKLAGAKRVVVYSGESSQDLGIFAYRSIGQLSLAAGSCIDFVNTIQKDCGVVIANCGQLIWYCRGNRAVTQQTWSAVPRKTGVSLPYKLDPEKNRVPGHGTIKEHVASVFQWVKQEADKGAKIDIIGVGDSVEEVVKYLRTNWDEWKDNIDAVAAGSGYVWLGENRDDWREDFANFWARRARVYLISREPLDTPLTGRDEFGCNCYSSGESTYVERIMPTAYQSMLSFFTMAARIPGYEEVEEPQLGDANELTMNM